MNSNKNLKNIPFGTLTDQLLKRANETFAPMYRHIYKKHWHNNTFTAQMPRSYNYTDWQNGEFETYLPSNNHTGQPLSYSRIAIKIVPEVNTQLLHQHSKKMQQLINPPIGNKIDSELIVIVSPKLASWGFIRAYKHIQAPGFLTAVLITKDKSGPLPIDAVWTRILRFVGNFLNKRITGFLKALGIQRYQLDGKDNNSLYYILCNSAVISRFGDSIRTSLLSLSESLDWIFRRILVAKEELVAESTANKVIEQLKMVNPEQLSKIFCKIRSGLELSLQTGFNRLNPIEVQLLNG
jgi:hypothetical protein